MAFPYKPVAYLTGANGPIHALAYSASPGTYILTGSADRAIRLHNPASTSASGNLIQTYSAHSKEVLALAVAADNARFASAGGDRTVFLWDVATAKTLRRFAHATDGHVGRVNSVAMGGAGDELVVSGGFDCSVRVWDCRQGGGGGGGGSRPVQVLDEARDAVSAVVVRGAEIVAGSVDGRVRAYDVRVGRCVTDVVGASVSSLCLTRDGKAMLVGSLDSKVRLLDREAGTCLQTYGADEASRSSRGGGRWWKNEDLRVQSVLGGHERFVVAGDEMTGGHDDHHHDHDDDDEEKKKEGAGEGAGGGRLWVWDLMTGTLVRRLTVPWGPAGTSSADKLKKVVGRDGVARARKYVVSCLAWREGGFGEQFCAGGTSGTVTVFGST